MRSTNSISREPGLSKYAASSRSTETAEKSPWRINFFAPCTNQRSQVSSSSFTAAFSKVITSFAARQIAIELSDVTAEINVEDSLMRVESSDFLPSRTTTSVAGPLSTVSPREILLMRSFKAFISSFSKSEFTCARSTPCHSSSLNTGLTGTSWRSCVSSRFVSTAGSAFRNASPALPGTESTPATNFFNEPNS